MLFRNPMIPDVWSALLTCGMSIHFTQSGFLRCHAPSGELKFLTLYRYHLHLIKKLV